MKIAAWTSFAVVVAATFFPAVATRAADPPAGAGAGDLSEAAAESGPDGDAARPAGRRTAVTISKQTTYIVAPLHEDGYVNYVSALNTLASAGVTPENNALVPLLKVVGPRSIDPEIRVRFFELLGMAPLPDEGDYLVRFEDHLAALNLDEEERSRIEHEQWTSVMEGPWSAERYPEIAGWVTRNDGVLDQAVAAARRPRFYSPMLAASEPEMLVAVLLPTLAEVRQVARALNVRAMLRLERGDVEAAWQDLQACHRLARLVAQGSTLIDALVGIAVEHIACSGDANLAHFGGLTEEQALGYARAIRELAPLSPLVDRIDVAERYTYLDSVCWVARLGPKALNSLDGGSSSKTAQAISRVVGRTLVDWDIPLKVGNQWYDRLVAAARRPPGEERDRALAAVDEELQSLSRESRDLKSFAGALLTGESPRTIASEYLADLFVALLLPAIRFAMDAEQRGAAQRDMAEISLALAAYRASEGKYPPQLDLLVPRQIPRLPQDPWAATAYHYQCTDDDFLLYGVGPNRKDDGGRSRRDGDDDATDDIALRVPKKTKQTE